MRLLKLIVALVILAVAGLAAYAYLGDMTPEQHQMRVPVTLSGGTAAPQPAATDASTPAPDAPAPAGETTATPQPAGADALD